MISSMTSGFRRAPRRAISSAATRASTRASTPPRARRCLVVASLDCHHPVQEMVPVEHWDRVGVEGLHALVLVFREAEHERMLHACGHRELLACRAGCDRDQIRPVPDHVVRAVRVGVVPERDLGGVVRCAGALLRTRASGCGQPVVPTVIPAEASKTNNSGVLLLRRGMWRPPSRCARR